MKKLFCTLAVCMVILFSGCTSEHKSDCLDVIFETDIGNDIDDALALDMLYKYMDQSKIDLLAVMLNKCAPAPAEFMDIMGTWYGYSDIPVGLIGLSRRINANLWFYTKLHMMWNSISILCATTIP